MYVHSYIIKTSFEPSNHKKFTIVKKEDLYGVGFPSRSNRRLAGGEPSSRNEFSLSLNIFFFEKSWE